MMDLIPTQNFQVEIKSKKDKSVLIGTSTKQVQTNEAN